MGGGKGGEKFIFNERRILEHKLRIDHGMKTKF